MHTISLWILGLLIHQVLARRICKIASGGSPQIFIPNLLVIGLDIDAMRGSLADVGGNTRLQSHSFRHIRTGHENISAMFCKILGYDIDFI